MLDANENPHRDPDTAMVMLTMASGALVHVNSSFRAVYGYDQRIEAFGEKGMLISRNQPADERSSATARAASARIRCCDFFIERYAESYRRELERVRPRARRKARAVDRARRRTARTADCRRRGGVGEKSAHR